SGERVRQGGDGKDAPGVRAAFEDDETSAREASSFPVRLETGAHVRERRQGERDGVPGRERDPAGGHVARRAQRELPSPLLVPRKLLDEVHARVVRQRV